MKTAVYFGSRAIYADMIPAAKSLLVNSDVDKIYLLIEDDVFPFNLCEKIETINIRDIIPKYFNPHGPNYKSDWTYIGLIRAALTKVFPELDVILSLDCDTIIDKNISEIWDISLNDYYFAAAREPILSRASRCVYTNAGVMLLNLKKLREDKKDDDIIDFLNNNKLFFITQDAMNFKCQGKILLLPSDYNASNYTEPTYNKKIIHYAGIRGKWRDYPLVKHYRDIPWKDICG